MYSSEKTDQHQ